MSTGGTSSLSAHTETREGGAPKFSGPSFFTQISTWFSFNFSKEYPKSKNSFSTKYKNSKNAFRTVRVIAARNIRTVRIMSVRNISTVVNNFSTKYQNSTNYVSTNNSVRNIRTVRIISVQNTRTVRIISVRIISVRNSITVRIISVKNISSKNLPLAVRARPFGLWRANLEPVPGLVLRVGVVQHATGTVTGTAALQTSEEQEYEYE
jgi:hypothetical protein